MEKELRKALKFVGNEIAKGNQKAICHAFVPLRLGICDCKEFLAFDPKIQTHSTSYYWWGTKTMNAWEGHETCRNARLLGIAFMLTMPEDMVPE